MQCHSRSPLIVLAFWVAVAGLAEAGGFGDGTAARAAEGGATPAVVAVVPMRAPSPAPRAHVPSATPQAAGSFDGVMALGAAAVALMLLCRSQQAQYPVFGSGTVVGALLAGTYGFLQGAWPLGVALTVYGIACAVRFYRPLFTRRRRPHVDAPLQRTSGRSVPPRWADPARVERMFGRS